MATTVRRFVGARFRRLGPGTRLAAVCLIVIFLVGLALIADGLMIKAGNDLGGVGAAPTRAATTRFTERAPGAPEATVRIP